MRLRSGALPTFLVTVNPIPGFSKALCTDCNENPGRFVRLPLAARKNSARLINRRIWTVFAMAATGPKALKPRGAYDRGRGVRSGSCDRSWWPCGHGNRDGGYARGGLADKYASLVQTAQSTVPLILFFARCTAMAHKTRLLGMRQSWAAYMKMLGSSQRKARTIAALKSRSRAF